MFLFLKPVLVFCAAAITLALILDGTYFVIAMSRDFLGIVSTRSGWVLIFGIIWAAAFAIGIFMTRQFHIFPFFIRTR